jgi:hypothetical protein
MQDKDECYRHERLGLQFLRSLRAGEPEKLAGLWQQAETDPAMEAMFEELLERESAFADDLPHPAQQANGRQPPLTQTMPSPTPCDHRPLPPVATVFVRHQLPVVEKRSDSVGPQSREEFRSNAGFIEKAQ